MYRRVISWKDPYPQDSDPEEADEEGEDGEATTPVTTPTPGGAEEEEGPCDDQRPRYDHGGVEDRRRGLDDDAFGRHRGAQVADGVISGAVAGVERFGGDDPHEGDDPGGEEEGSGERLVAHRGVGGGGGGI